MTYTGTELLLVRHAEARYNQMLDSGLPTTVSSVGASTLTGEGELQTADLAERLADIRIGQIFASPTGSARATAALLARSLLPRQHPDVVYDLRELDFGTGARTGAGFASALKTYMDSWSVGRDPRLPGGESLLDVANRMRSGICHCLSCTTARPILVVSHQSAIAAYMGLILGVPLAEAEHIFRLPHGGYSSLSFSGGGTASLRGFSG